MKDFTIASAVDRVKKEGDLFKPVLGKGIQMKKAIDALENTFASILGKTVQRRSKSKKSITVH